MTIDYNKNNYTKIGSYSNVLYEWPNDSQHDYNQWTLELNARMAPLVHKIAMAHPEWTLVMTGGFNSNIEPKRSGIVNVKVVCEDEVIGTIGLDSWKTGTPYSISCDKIANARERGRAAWTTKLEKAYKLVEENFAPVSLPTKMHRAVNNLSQVISTAVYNRSRACSDALTRLHPALAAYIVNNLAEISKAPEMVGVSTQLEVIPTLLEDKRIGESFSHATRNGQGFVVVIHKDKYLVKANAAPSGDFHVLTASDLTEDMASKIGLLKALDTDNEIIEGVGVRTNGNAYFIL